MKIRQHITTGMLALAGLALITPAAEAALVNYSRGDLLMGFVATGVNQVYVLDLGSAITYRDTTSNILTITGASINTDLTTVFGANWWDNSNLYFGVIGVYDSAQGDPVVSGDPGDTVYASKSRTSVATQSTAWGSPSILGSTSRGDLGTTVDTFQGAFAVNAQQATNSHGSIMTESVPLNTWDNFNPPATGSVSFDQLNNNTLGIEQKFAAGSYGTFTGIGAVEGAVDLYRILDSTTGANPTGTVGRGTYEGTFTIDNAGNVAFLTANPVPEPSTYGLVALGIGLLAVWRKRQSGLKRA